MGAVQGIVAIRGDDERRHGLQPAHKQAQHVQGGFVRPVQVLQHEDAWRACKQQAREAGRDLVRLAVVLHGLDQLSAGGLGHRQERT